MRGVGPRRRKLHRAGAGAQPRGGGELPARAGELVHLDIKKLARFRRRTCVVSKAKRMVEASIALFARFAYSMLRSAFMYQESGPKNVLRRSPSA